MTVPLLLHKAGACLHAAFVPDSSQGPEHMQPTCALTGMGASKANLVKFHNVIPRPFCLPLDCMHNKAIMGFSVCLGSLPYEQQLHPGRRIVQPWAFLCCSLGVFQAWHSLQLVQEWGLSR